MKQALSGVRVLDFTQVMAGPFCAMLLGDLGAEVIKVEPPGGDSTRKMGQSVGTESPGFWAVNRNKRGMVLNLKDPRGQAIVRTLVTQTDIVVENYRPGVLHAFGLSYEDLRRANPALNQGGSIPESILEHRNSSFPPRPAFLSGRGPPGDKPGREITSRSP